MVRIADYRIVEAGSSEGLERIVKACLINKWKPIGGITFNEYGIYHQALVLEEEN